MGTLEERISLAKSVFTQCLKLMEAKAVDYSGAEDVNKNLMACEYLKYCSAEIGVLIRIQDKLARLKHLSESNKEAAVKDESIKDTVADICNYSVILLHIIMEKKAKQASTS